MQDMGCEQSSYKTYISIRILFRKDIDRIVAETVYQMPLRQAKGRFRKISIVTRVKAQVEVPINKKKKTTGGYKQKAHHKNMKQTHARKLTSVSI